jgi:hypothetical protein
MRYEILVLSLPPSQRMKVGRMGAIVTRTYKQLPNQTLQSTGLLLDVSAP